MYPIKTKNRKAISAVLTTIIILVASIVLGTGVVVYSTSLFQTGGQQQNVQIIGVKTWVNASSGSTYAWGAAAIKNTGDKILSLSSISIRGVTMPYTNWFADTDPTRVSANFQSQLNATKMDNNGFIKGSILSGAGTGPVTGIAPSQACTQGPSNNYPGPPTMLVIQEISLPGAAPTVTPLCLAQQSGPIALLPGASAIVYYKLPNGLLNPTDSGVVSTVSYLAGNVPVSQTVRIANP